MIFLIFVASLAIGLAINGINYLVVRRGAKQRVLEYVTEHKAKDGTPTMGGVGIVCAIAISYFVFGGRNNSMALLVLCITFAYALIGFLDDFIKIKFNRNLGLKAYQKIIAQLSIAVIVAIYVYRNDFIGCEVLLPFSNNVLMLNNWIIPLVIFIFLACVNGVNLTDGLDGLATNVTMIYLVFFCILLYFQIQKISIENNVRLQEEYENLLKIGVVGVGVLLSFLAFNCFPAKIFMGDVGSLALGALIACISIFTKMSLYIPVLGVMYVISCLSVIIQVAYFKATKGKRIFLMSPYHHHLQKRGLSETRISVIYSIVTIVAGSILVACELYI